MSAHRFRRSVATWLAVLAFVFCAVALFYRTQPVLSVPRLVLAVGSTLVPLAALVGLALAVLARRVVLSIIGVGLLIAAVVVQGSWYYGGRPADIGDYTALRVLSSNIQQGRVDAADFVQLASQNADVITVAELTPEAVQSITDAGIGVSFPYSHLIPGADSGGIGLWSRFPISIVSETRHRHVNMPAARLEVPGLEYEPLVASVHITSPIAGDADNVDQWRYSMAGAKAQMNTFAAAAGPAAVIIGGDYNSTPDMRQYRDFLTNGYRDAVEQTGAGYAPTFRADTWFPPIITIDHILTRNAAVESVRTVKLKGIDHRALLATVHLPLHPE